MCAEFVGPAGTSVGGGVSVSWVSGSVVSSRCWRGGANSCADTAVDQGGQAMPEGAFASVPGVRQNHSYEPGLGMQQSPYRYRSQRTHPRGYLCCGFSCAIVGWNPDGPSWRPEFGLEGQPSTRRRGTGQDGRWTKRWRRFIILWRSKGSAAAEPAVGGRGGGGNGGGKR